MLQKLWQNKVFMKGFSVVSILMVLCISAAMFAFAEDPQADMTATEAASQIFTSITGVLNIRTIVAVLGIAITAALGMALAWWAIRKVYNMVMSAFRKGRAKV